MECHVSSTALPRKLTGSTSIYDGVFSGSSRGAQTSSGVEDYAEVFGGGENARRETIPVLDIPCFREGRARVDVRTSALDYSAVFGWGAGGFVASSYEEVVGDAAKEGRRVKAKKRSSSQLSNIGSEEGYLVHESSTPSSEAKRFNVSYSKSNVGSNGKPNGAVHVARLADVPGYSILTEESGRLNQEKVDMQPVGGGEAGKHSGVGMVEGINCKSASFSVSAENSTEQSSRKVISGHRSSKDGSFSGELLFDRCGFMVGKDSYGQNPPSNLCSALPGKKGEMNGRLSPRSVSEGVDGTYSLPDLGSELDANSAAAATGAAVKIAIEKAQARIKAAKAIMEGRKVFEFKVSVKKKFGREHEKGDMKAKKEDLTSKVLHQKVHDEDTRVCLLGGILQPNLSKVHAVNGELIDPVKVPLSNESIVAGPREKCSEIGVNCWKGEVENREQEEDLFEDARAEPHHPERDEQREAIGVKKENQPSDMLVSNFNRSASRTSATVVNFEPALDEGLCQEKAKQELLIFREANESKEQIVPFEFAEKMTAKKENAPAIHTVSDGLMGIKKFAFHFHMTPFEKLPVLRIPEPEVKHDFQLLVGQNFFNCAAEVNADDEEERENGDDFSNEHDDEMRGDLVMEIGNCEFGKEQEHCRDVVNREMQLEEHGLEYNIGSLEVEPETGLSEIYGPAIPKEWNDVLAGENDGGCQEEREFWESPNCKEADLSETILPDGYRTEDLELHPETCDVIKAEKVPTGEKPTRRCWTVEAHDVRQLINAVAANACEPNVHKQLIGTQGSNGQNQDQTADEVTDDVDKEDSDKIILKNASAVLGDMECVLTEVPSDSIMEEKCSDEPADLVCNTFRNEKNSEDYASEAFIYRGAAAANLDNASVDSDLTCDEVSERSSSDEAPVQGTFFKSEDIKLNESDVSQCSGQESEASVEEAKSETEAEVSGDDFNYEVIAEVRRLDDGLVVKGKGQTAEERTNTEKNGENHHTKLMTEEVEAKGSLRSEMQVEEASGKNADEDKGKERAREKERKAVERAIREARERAYVEARERAGRAAVEKATAEARQRGIAQAREKLGMSSLEPSNKADDKKLMKAKLIAERAAVERATAEARERALEKALAEKRAAGDEDHKPRKKSNPQHRNSGSSSTSKRPSTSDPSTHCAERSEEDDGESARRWKARLERHQRTAERAAKALAEKNKRDLLAQKEQAERSRLAETLDADIKRWSSGKQGNLRALLSTLQYILGPDSGWQPVTLMEILTAPAVRKAYRKATLYVHPDKLQQRGASLQQKYVCEKVFDLLKDAWNKFSAEER